MKTENMMKKIEKIPAGRYFRMRYLSKLPVKKQFVDEGISVVKIVDITTRTGVRYSNIASVINKEKTRTTEKRETTNNYEWIIPNRIKYNTNTRKYYFVTAPTTRGAHPHATYIVSTPEGTHVVSNKEDIKNYILDSYWRETVSPINMISLDSVLHINI